MVKSHTLPWHLNQSAVMGGQAAQVRLERMHAFVEEVENAAREHERRIINFVIENRTINVTQAKDLLNRRWHFAKKILTGLVERDILDRVHSQTTERDAFAYYTLPKRLSDRIARYRPH